MFTKKPQVAEIIKKSTLKVQDQKKEVFSRLKHIRTIVDHVDSDEAKAFFEANYSHIFYILHETFVQAETNLKQRELSFHLVHKAHREELDGSIWLLGKVIVLLPELIAKRWQCHSTSRILMKLLHHGNSTKLRRDGVRFFLMWYQALGISEHGAPDEAHAMFADCVPGLTIPQKNRQGPQTLSPTTSDFTPKDFTHDLMNHPNFRISSEIGQSVFHDQPTKAPDITPLILPASNERTVTPDPQAGLEILLECMVQSTGCLKWSDNNIQRHLKGFLFLLQRFREVYLPVFCPNFDNSASIYEPKLDLPVMRTISKREEVMSSCVVVLINWISKYTNDRHTLNKTDQHHIFEDVPEQASLVSNLRHMGYTQTQIVREVFYSSRDTINFVNEVYRQAFLLNFSSRSCIDAMKTSIGTYRDWMSSQTPPPFLLENENSGDNSSASSSLESTTSCSNRIQRLRADSYIGAISKDNFSIRAGMQNVLQVFVTNAVNVFMVSTSHLNTYVLSKSKDESTTPLDEQTEICKRVLNIYRTMVMKTKMEGKTWKQLLMVLLQITSVILAEAPPNAKRNNLGGRLAQPIFQTLIVTWIRAHTNVVVPATMWEKFLKVLSSLTHREELIIEWDKTMQTLTRVLARQVYNLNLQDLPLDRLAEQKGKRRRIGATSTNVWQNSQNSTENQHNVSTTNSGLKKEENSQESHLKIPKRHIPGTPLLNRSYSEGSLATPYRKSRARRRIKIHQMHELPINIEQTINKIANTSAQLSVSMETLNISKISTSGEHNQSNVRKALSLDSIQQRNEDNESFRESRSPSPTASSGLDGNSIKDSPHAIDAIAAGDSSSLETHEEGLDRKSILAGGIAKGWLPDVACIMWRRMLGSLGDVNKILNPKLHAEVFRYLVNITESLIKIRMNQGVSTDPNVPPTQPTLVPPINLILPWCFGALSLDSQYQLGKVYAMQLICMIAKNSSLTGDQLPLFYQALHQSLTGENRQMASTALKYLGPRFLSLLMPGHSLLYLDLIHACTMVLTSMDVKAPRSESVGLLGSLLCFPKTSLPGPVLQPSEPHIFLIECPDIQEHILNIVLRCARREPTAKARSIAITSLGQWIIQNLTNPSHEITQNMNKKSRNNSANTQSSSTFEANPRIPEAFQVILQALQFKHRVIARIACETLRLCSEKGKELAMIDKLPGLTIEALCYSLEIQNIPNPKECDKNVLTSMLLCLGELCMAFPMSILMDATSDEQEPLLLMIFRVLHRIAMGKHSERIKMYTIDDDFDMSIVVDDVKEQSNTEANYQTQETIQQCKASIQLCAKTVAMHLVTNISHFPLGIGASRLSAMVDEHDDMSIVPQGAREIQRESSIDMYASQVLTSSNLQLLMLSSELVSSFIELPALKLPSADGLITANRQVRMILRDLNGKSCWDASIIYCEPRICMEIESSADEIDFDCSSRQKSFMKPNFPIKNQIGISLDPMISTVGINMNFIPQPRHTLRHRPPHQLPVAKDIAPDLDQLDDLLQFIGYTSPECLDENVQALNVAGQSPLGSSLEAQTIAILLNQRAMESDYSSRKNQSIDLSSTTSDFYNSNSMEFASFGDDITIRSNTSTKSDNRLDLSLPLSVRGKNEPPIFHYGRLLFNQLGLAGWERRKRTHLLSRTDKLLRELRNLDAQKCRETHKVAVIYVANGQEDKNSILRNSSGSSTYEMFVSALGWEIELETHHGFLGGLPRQGCGQTAPYFATPFLEVIFHVSTRIPSDTHEAILNKTRHLGNDEVHIVWSEHNRDYRRDILPTEFCDVLIVIYPLKSGLFRVTVNKKPDVPWFGPVSDEIVVSGTNLASLVRASAINASRAKRYAMPFYQQFYEERNRSLETVASRHKESRTFEEFITKIYSPVIMNQGSVSGTITTAALIDHHQQHHKSSIKNNTNWLQHHITQRQTSDLSESPSMLRKLPFCYNLPKKSSSSTTIPLSPPTTLSGRRLK